MSDSFPADWEHSNEDRQLEELLRGYWAAFAKTGDPNFDHAPKWPAFKSNYPEYFEVGAQTGMRPVSERIRALETIMRHILAQ